MRLKTRQEFKRVQREGRRVQGKCLVFQLASENLNYPRLGITVSKQYGSAVERNLFKRRVRELFRLAKHQLPQGMTLHISPKLQAGLLSFEQMQTDFIVFLQSIS